MFERFVRDWQDPQTGFFGMTYIVDDEGSEIRTTDLSLTFHMARYVPHLVRWWPTLIDTLLGISEQQYPQGWIQDGKMSDHNNYDVVELFYRGWKHMSPGQRRLASRAVATMFEWCLAHSVGQNGEIIEPDKGDMIPDSYYFAAAFLDTIGFFDRGKRFWTDRMLPDPEPIRKGMVAQLSRFNADLTVVDDTLERLHARSAAMVERDFLAGPAVRRRTSFPHPFPPLLRRVVFGAGFDPALAVGRLLALPERSVGLQPVDQEMAGGERGLAVRRGGGDEDDAVAGFEPAVAVDDQRGVERPAPMRLELDLGELLLGHSGIVFEGQGRDLVTAAHVAHQPDEAGDPADPVIAGGEPIELDADIKILALHTDHRLSLR